MVKKVATTPSRSTPKNVMNKTATSVHKKHYGVTPINQKGKWYPGLAVLPPSLPEYISGDNFVKPRYKIKPKLKPTQKGTFRGRNSL